MSSLRHLKSRGDGDFRGSSGTLELRAERYILPFIILLVHPYMPFYRFLMNRVTT